MATSRSDYGQNTPTFNVDRKISNFADFVDNIPQEAEELKDLERGLDKHEENDVGNISNKTKNKYNRVSHKIDQLSKDEVKDKLNALEEKNSFGEEGEDDGFGKNWGSNYSSDEVHDKNGYRGTLYRSSQIKKSGFDLLQDALIQLGKENVKREDIDKYIDNKWAWARVR